MSPNSDNHSSNSGLENNSANESVQKKGETMLIALGFFLSAAWLVFAGIHIQDWLSAKETLASRPLLYEVSDQGLLTMLSVPLLGIFAFLFIRHTDKRKAEKTTSLAPIAGLSVLALTAIGLPLAVIDNKMQWYVDAAAPTAYVLCEEVRHGKGKNTWRAYTFGRADVGCPPALIPQLKQKAQR